MMKHTNDLGKDPIFPLVLRLAIPTMLAQFVSVLYSIVDRCISARELVTWLWLEWRLCAPVDYASFLLLLP